MKAFVFIGPTISTAEASRWLDAEYLPPVSQGEVASLLRSRPDVIGIIDGYFDQVPSAWHKEILVALAQGVTVAGASSMGALRAAELHHFGMIGVGQIFEWYRDGVIEADDEVAIRHAPADLDYQPLTEAMVNIRSTLNAACRDGQLSSATRDVLIELGRQLPYGERSYPAVLARGAQAGLPPAELEALRAYVAAHAIDQKKLDAIAMLQQIAAGELSRSTRTADLLVQPTIFLNWLVDRDVRLDPPGNGTGLRLDDLADFARLADPGFRDVISAAGARRLHIEVARELGFRVSDEEIASEIVNFSTQRGLEGDDELQDWLTRNMLTQDELSGFVQGMLLESKLLKAYSAPENRDLLWQLRLEGKFESLLANLRRREAMRLASGAQLGTTSEELLISYREQTGSDWPRTVDEAIEALGFHNENSLRIELQKIYQDRQRTSGLPQS